MRIAFMGTPEFALPTLEELYNCGHDILAVFTQPDKPRGRGKKIYPTPVKELAQSLNLKVYQPKSIKSNEIVELLRNLDLDCIVVVAYGQILPKAIIDLPKYGCINVHASLLPKYRGAAPINWAIINGEEKTGITTMVMDEGLDTGDILLMDEIPIDAKTTAGELHDKLAVLGAKVLIKTLDLLEKDKIKPIPQDDRLSSYAKMLSKEDGKINWNCKAKDIYNLIRGLNPWPVAHTKYNKDMIKIWKAELTDESSSGYIPGEIVEVNKNGIKVATGDKNLLISEIQFPNNRKMTVGEYILGNKIDVGVVLGE